MCWWPHICTLVALSALKAWNATKATHNAHRIGLLHLTIWGIRGDRFNHQTTLPKPTRSGYSCLSPVHQHQNPQDSLLCRSWPVGMLISVLRCLCKAALLDCEGNMSHNTPMIDQSLACSPNTTCRKYISGVPAYTLLMGLLWKPWDHHAVCIMDSYVINSRWCKHKCKWTISTVTSMFSWTSWRAWLREWLCKLHPRKVHAYQHMQLPHFTLACTQKAWGCVDHTNIILLLSLPSHAAWSILMLLIMVFWCSTVAILASFKICMPVIEELLETLTINVAFRHAPTQEPHISAACHMIQLLLAWALFQVVSNNTAGCMVPCI